MNKIKMMIDEFYSRYNIYPNKMILGINIVSPIINEMLEKCCTIQNDNTLQIFGINVEIDFRHENRISIILELMGGK